eukprot:CAMPEP_0119561784 /NCGR_PEP_ID=MMETSP1352-20130426/18617_1 /TAXON_ID=265584 /ORGANISM="Stauroneis constricta, Strain CCMP1120" /LENGTH=411 /DNA_ID=CAMNT_0007610067 /DNA_START=117 /DNA_END=1349 /DNA_ORIENTATION=+
MKFVPTQHVLLIAIAALSTHETMGFSTPPSSTHAIRSLRLHAKPARFEENVDGPLYVNDKCINCAACSHFAPTVFSRASRDYGHIVHHQPSTDEEILAARASLAACPVAAIRVETSADRHHRGMDAPTPDAQALAPKLAINPKFNGLELPFPRPVAADVAPGVYFVGHHNDKSFGATPYLVSTRTSTQTDNDDDDETNEAWIMVDSPRYSKSAVSAVEKVTGSNGPRYMFLTHVDDTADHQKWIEHYPSMKRIFHSGDLGRHNWIGDKNLETVEILLQNAADGAQNDDPTSPLQAYRLDGSPIDSLEANEDDAVILHTPGHSPGSITLWKKPNKDSCGILFTGDTYGYTTRDGGHMTGFPRYGNNMKVLQQTLDKFMQMNAGETQAWSMIVPGHGHLRDYTKLDGDTMLQD